MECRVTLLERNRQAQDRADSGAFGHRLLAVTNGIRHQQTVADGGIDLLVGHVLDRLAGVWIAAQIRAFDAPRLLGELTALNHAEAVALECAEVGQRALFVLAHDQLGAGIAIGFAEIQTFLEFGGGSDLVQGDVVFATLDTRQQIVASRHHELGAYFQLVGQQPAKFDFKPRQLAVILEVERRHVGFDGNAQFATVIHVIDQFGMCPWAEQGGK
ncbi:hypothetical protein D3C75_865520 [compost metagenome]